MSLPAKLRAFEGLIDIFTEEGRASAERRLGPRRSNGRTLRPSALATPLWRKLVEDIRPWLKRRGEKAQLARLLGVHRQSINEYFVSGSRMPDAERTLLLLEWLEARRNHRAGPS